jgi:hypothetical protein
MPHDRSAHRRISRSCDASIAASADTERRSPLRWQSRHTATGDHQMATKLSNVTRDYRAAHRMIEKKLTQIQDMLDEHKFQQAHSPDDRQFVGDMTEVLRHLNDALNAARC